MVDLAIWLVFLRLSKFRYIRSWNVYLGRTETGINSHKILFFLLTTSLRASCVFVFAVSYFHKNRRHVCIYFKRSLTWKAMWHQQPHGFARFAVLVRPQRQASAKKASAKGLHVAGHASQPAAQSCRWSETPLNARQLNALRKFIS